MQSVVSLYCLDNDDDYLGCCEADQVGMTWLNFETVTKGTFFLSSRRILFEPCNAQSLSAPILTFQLTDVDDVALDMAAAPWSLGFQSKCHSEGTTRPADPLVGPWVAVHRTTRWRFRFSSSTDDWRASLTTLVAGGVERRLQTRERQIQSAHADCASFPVKRVLPLREQRGVVLIASDRASFEPLFGLGEHGSRAVDGAAVSFLFPRWVLFEDVGLDFHSVAPEAVGTPRALAFSAPLLSLKFFSPAEKREAVRALDRLSGAHLLEVSLTELTRCWQLREMSNYEYLITLNLLASRSRLDLHQYPVFPWVLRDYSSELDVQHPSAYRDLSKPIGALQPSRLAELKARAEVLADMGQPMCLYTSHYSSAWAVSYYLVRPHPEYQFCLQSGRLDNADRLFESLPATWANVNRGSADVKELIPEFFENAFLALSAPPPGPRRLSLGRKQDGSAVAPSVRLPASVSSPQSFLQLHRAALESEYVSSTIHLWIDLIFGAKQDGPDAELAGNVFHPYCYPQPASAGGELTGASSGFADTRAYAREFGNVPMKLFSSLHPGRNSYTSETRQTAYARCVTQTQDHTSQTARRYGDDDDDASDREEVTGMPVVAAPSSSSSVASEDTDDGAAQEMSLSSIPVVCGLTEAARLTTNVRHPHALVLSVFASDSGDEAEQHVMMTVVDKECQSVFLYDCFSGDRLRCFSDFDTPIEHAAGYHELVLLFTRGGALYVLDVRACTVVGHVPAVCRGAPVRRCSFAPTLFALVDAESCVSVWYVQGDNVEASLSAAPLTHLEAPAAVSCLCVRAERHQDLGDGVHVALCTSANELVQCRGPRADAYTSHLISSLATATAMSFTSAGDAMAILVPHAIFTVDAESGAVVRQVLLSRAVPAAPLPLLYDGADYLLVLSDTSLGKPDGECACPIVLVRDGYVAGGVVQGASAAPCLPAIRASAEYFLLGTDPHGVDIVVYSVDAS